MDQRSCGYVSRSDCGKRSACDVYRKYRSPFDPRRKFRKRHPIIEAHSTGYVGDDESCGHDSEQCADQRTDRAESINLASQRPDKAKQLEELWDRQLAEMSQLAAKTAPRKRNSAK